MRENNNMVNKRTTEIPIRTVIALFDCDFENRQQQQYNLIKENRL